MCATLPNDDLLNLCTTDRAGCAFAVVHSKIILELTAAIRPIKGCAIATDAGPQNLADRFMQRLSLLRCY